MLSYMKKSAANKWMQAKNAEIERLMEEKALEPTDTKPEEQVHLPTWKDFLPVDLATSARIKMKSLKQNKQPIDEYINNFKLLAADTTYDDAALIDHFLNGLNERLLGMCLSTPDQLDNIEEWYD
uniref:Retrotransposon gag domain-containing protein n=2 Tax=Moniliophthora roreri TaxID=221103 RepID=A0A0W0F4T7_MONRR